MKKMILVALCLVALGLPARARAQQMFDFYGQAILPAGPGGALSLYTVVRPTVPGVTNPLSLDHANFEYTLVIENLILDVDGLSQIYSGGNLTLYEDSSTAADPGDPATFTDGTALLVGNVPNLTRTVLLGFLGTVSGTVDWTGGTRIGELAPGDRPGWTFLSATNSNPTGLPAGYDELWDGKLEPQEPVVGTVNESWGEVKTRF